MSKLWRLIFKTRKRVALRPGQAYVEFALVLMIIITLLVGGVLVIRALFLEENLHDIATRAVQWGASTNNYGQVMQIIHEASSFATDLQGTLTYCPAPEFTNCTSSNFTIDLQAPFSPSDNLQRAVGPYNALFTVSLHANVPMVGPGLALVAPLGAQASALIEHTPMSFSQPLLTSTPLRIGDNVLVHTTAGDLLTVRHNPGLDGIRAFYMHDGDHAVIVGGPALANGLRWWQIVYGRSKLIGWCVDQADAVITLVPYF
jgi:hypothetical protein